MPSENTKNLRFSDVYRRYRKRPVAWNELINYMNNVIKVILGAATEEKCPYSEFFWPAFLQIRTEYGEILHISPYSFQMRKNTDEKNSEYGHISRSVLNEDKYFWPQKCTNPCNRFMKICSWHCPKNQDWKALLCYKNEWTVIKV